jgi:hypothetical protein
MGIEMVSETSVIFNHLTRLTALEDFINFSGRERFRSYINLIICLCSFTIRYNNIASIYTHVPYIFRLTATIRPIPIYKLQLQALWTSTDSAVGTAASLRARSPKRHASILFLTPSRSALESTQPPIQWVPGIYFLGGKVTGTWSLPLISI